MRFLRLVIVLACAGLGVALAQKGPPQAAFDACAKSKVGDKCTFKGRAGSDASGTCQTARDASKGLVCRRDGMGSGKGSGSGSGSGKGSGSGSGSGSGKGSAGGGNGGGGGKGSGGGGGKGSGSAAH